MKLVRPCAKYGVKCVTYWEQMNGLDPLKDDIHLPGWDSSYTQDEVRGLIHNYDRLGENGLWANIEYFVHLHWFTQKLSEE